MAKHVWLKSHYARTWMSNKQQKLAKPYIHEVMPYLTLDTFRFLTMLLTLFVSTFTIEQQKTEILFFVMALF